jgi:hypothetical protein
VIQDRSLTYDEVADILGVRYPHVMYLLRTHRLEPSPEGGVTPDSVQAFRETYRLGPEYLAPAETSRRLGISRNHVPLLVAAGLVAGVTLPNPLGGTWVYEPDLKGLDMKKVAQLGIKVPAPEGYLSGADTRRRLSIGRSSLRWLVNNGTIRSLYWSPMNVFYLQEDVEVVASLR